MRSYHWYTPAPKVFYAAQQATRCDNEQSRVLRVLPDALQAWAAENYSPAFCLLLGLVSASPHWGQVCIQRQGWWDGRPDSSFGISAVYNDRALDMLIQTQRAPSLDSKWPASPELLFTHPPQAHAQPVSTSQHSLPFSPLVQDPNPLSAS